jgi:hypothetical protein
MRRSTYEIILPLIQGSDEIKDRMLLVNGLYSSFDVVTKEEAEKFAAGDFAGLSPALRERLLLRGHLTRKSEAEELADMKLIGRVHRMIPARSGIGIVIGIDSGFQHDYFNVIRRNVQSVQGLFQVLFIRHIALAKWRTAKTQGFQLHAAARPVFSSCSKMLRWSA